MLAGLWPLNQHVCWSIVTQYCMSAGDGFSICYTCWYGVSLSAVPAGLVLHIDHSFWFGTSLSAMPVDVVPHYWSCLLVWCLTVGYVFWCGASLYAMPVGVVPHYRPCLLVRFAIQPTFWLVECRWKRDGYKSGASLTDAPITYDMFANLVPLSDMPACTVQLYQTCMLGTRVCKVLLHQARNLVC